MDRRNFITSGLATGALLAAPPAFGRGSPAGPAGNRAFDVTTTIALAEGAGAFDLFVPLFQPRPAQELLERAWSPGGSLVPLDQHTDAAMLHYRAGRNARTITITERVALEDRLPPNDIANKLTDAERAHWTRPPSRRADRVILQETAARLTTGLADDRQKLRAIYDWVVANTWRDPAVRACGIGDPGAMLREGRMGGKCADINSLAVCLARAAGIPAREMFGIRLAPSRIAASMGAADDITGAQHCRAEAWLQGAGWFPIDPADIRKVMLEEQRGLGDPRIIALADRLFGFAEANWAAYNSRRDLVLPGATQAPAHDFLMYPTAIASGRVLGPEALSYRITSRPVAA